MQRALVVAFYLLTSAATAHAECAWVLWKYQDMERGVVGSGPRRVQEGARGEESDSTRGLVQLSNPAVEAALRDHLRAVEELLIRERGSSVEMLEGDRERWVR